MSDYLKRGNLMWEGSRMMLPEHIQALRQRRKRAEQDAPPSLTEDDLTELGIVAMDSLHYALEVKIVYWQDGANIEIIGIIDYMDHQLKRLKINGEWISVNALKQIEKI
ncbi:YolD-like family protein [Salipaludibacillus daqingensis]|uniref:YolD-like family protein n=1 Tax=Salipaludibacillus daqingensis TaxID=3041001 RepID=UPI002475AF77|nr:YolD-like family protein [Salipaludibacillus daqingensis]